MTDAEEAARRRREASARGTVRKRNTKKAEATLRGKRSNLASLPEGEQSAIEAYDKAIASASSTCATNNAMETLRTKMVGAAGYSPAKISKTLGRPKTKRAKEARARPQTESAPQEIDNRGPICHWCVPHVSLGKHILGIYYIWRPHRRAAGRRARLAAASRGVACV